MQPVIPRLLIRSLTGRALPTKFSGGSMFNLSGSLTRSTGGRDAVRPNMPWERPCRLTCRPSSLRGGWATMFHQSRRNLKKGSKMTVSKRKKRRKRMEKRMNEAKNMERKRKEWDDKNSKKAKKQ